MADRELIERLLGRVSVLEMEVGELKDRLGEGDFVRPGGLKKDDFSNTKAGTPQYVKEVKERKRGEWIPLTEVDTRKYEKSLIAPCVIRFPSGSEREIKFWTDVPFVVADDVYIDESLREYIARPKNRRACIEEACRIAGSHAEDYAIAFWE